MLQDQAARLKRTQATMTFTSVTVAENPAEKVTIVSDN